VFSSRLQSLSSLLASLQRPYCQDDGGLYGLELLNFVISIASQISVEFTVKNYHCKIELHIFHLCFFFIEIFSSSLVLVCRFFIVCTVFVTVLHEIKHEKQNN